ncbi:hypothetical protein VNO80_28676 [Phaseolus coccineus]|uniref:Ribosomal RNA methyltransferase FtsJ domain-containing protein n=1 Tax=Phaseolus coccineus TaxID=3886 RepID=A0AAN9LAV4_PHACN
MSALSAPFARLLYPTAQWFHSTPVAMPQLKGKHLLVIPPRPPALCAQDLVVTSSRGGQHLPYCNPYQGHYFSSRPYQEEDATSRMLNLGSYHHPVTGMFGEMVYSRVFGNPENFWAHHQNWAPDQNWVPWEKEKVIRHFDSCKADLVVCDGVPDVTGLHDMDEFVQFQLILAVRVRSSSVFFEPVEQWWRSAEQVALVAIVERRLHGGRESSYNLRRLCFAAKVILPTFAKPKSSHNSSIEAFAVCENYSPPEGFNPKDLHRLLEKDVAFKAAYFNKTKATRQDKQGVSSKHLFGQFFCGLSQREMHIALDPCQCRGAFELLA